MRIIVFCAISGLGLLGCTAQEKAQMELQQKTKMESALTPYVGRSIADFMIDRGPSTSTIDLGPNKRAFQWKITGQTAGALVPLSGMLGHGPTPAAEVYGLSHRLDKQEEPGNV
jgi:hypothetical protein